MRGWSLVAQLMAQPAQTSSIPPSTFTCAACPGRDHSEWALPWQTLAPSVFLFYLFTSANTCALSPFTAQQDKFIKQSPPLPKRWVDDKSCAKHFEHFYKQLLSVPISQTVTWFNSYAASWEWQMLAAGACGEHNGVHIYVFPFITSKIPARTKCSNLGF